MPFGFTELDPVIVAKFWIYFIGSLVVGGVVGWFFHAVLTKSSSDKFRSEEKTLKKERGDLLEIKKKYEELQKEVEKSHEFWVYEKREGGLQKLDNDPSKLLSAGYKKIKSSD